MSDEASDEPSAHEEQPATTESEKPAEEEEQQISFTSYQLFVFLTSFVCYSIMLYNRKAFTFTLPYVIMDEHFSSSEVGYIMGAQTFTYTISRFIASVATDSYPPRIMLMGGLFFTGFVTLAFSDQEDYANITILTAANGLMQGMGWPAVSKMIRTWFPPPQYGLAFALLSSATNLIATVGPGIAGAMAYGYGWRFALQIPALLAVIAAVCSYFCLWDRPSDVGYEDQYSQIGDQGEHWSDLAGSEFMAYLCAVYFLLSMVKTCCEEWGQQYLLQERGVSAYPASSYLKAMEVGGLVGCIVVGALSDLMIKMGHRRGEPNKSPRMTLVEPLMAGTVLFFNLFLFSIEPESTRSFMTALGLVLGFFIYGSISLLGTIAIEKAPITVTGSAQAAIGLAGNFGAMAASSPVHFVANSWDWFTAFMGVNCLGLLAFVILVMGKDIPALYSQSGGGPPKIKFQ